MLARRNRKDDGLAWLLLWPAMLCLLIAMRCVSLRRNTAYRDEPMIVSRDATTETPAVTVHVDYWLAALATVGHRRAGSFTIVDAYRYRKRFVSWRCTVLASQTSTVVVSIWERWSAPTAMLSVERVDGTTPAGMVVLASYGEEAILGMINQFAATVPPGEGVRPRAEANWADWLSRNLREERAEWIEKQRLSPPRDGWLAIPWRRALREAVAPSRQSLLPATRSVDLGQGRGFDVESRSSNELSAPSEQEATG